MPVLYYIYTFCLYNSYVSFIIGNETTCEKKRKGNTSDLEVIFVPRTSGKHTLEIRILNKVLVNEDFEIKQGLY